RRQPDRYRARAGDRHHHDRRVLTTPAVAEDAARPTPEPTRADHCEGRIGRGGPRREQLIRGEHDEPRPHRVQLPHVPEVAERGETDATVVEHEPGLPRIERRAWERERTVATR